MRSSLPVAPGQRFAMRRPLIELFEPSLFVLSVARFLSPGVFVRWLGQACRSLPIARPSCGHWQRVPWQKKIELHLNIGAPTSYLSRPQIGDK